MVLPYPEVEIGISDGGLGVVGQNGGQQFAFIGTSALGTPNTFYSFTSPEGVKKSLGAGPLAEAMAHALQVGGGPVYCVPCTASISGTLGATVETRAASSLSTGYVFANGTPSADAQIIATVTSATPDLVSSGNVTIDLSLDGGTTTTSVSIPASGVLSISGTLELNFSGLFFQGDTVTLNVTNGVAVSQSPALSHASGAVSTGTFATSGNPADSYSVLVKITKTGIVELGTVLQFQVSLDGGQSFRSSVICPSSGIYEIPNSGVEFTLSGWYNEGDIFTFDTVAPGYTLGDASAAFSVLKNYPSQWGGVFFVGEPKGATSSIAANNAAAFGVGAATLLNSASVADFRYARAYTEASNSLPSDLIAAFQNVADTRLVVGAGKVGIQSGLDGRIMKRNFQWSHVARLSQIAVSEDAGWVGRGALQGVISSDIDISTSNVLMAARFVTARTHPGRSGFYVMRSITMAPQGSDYEVVPNCRVMDVACSVVRASLLPYLNSALRINADGTINEADARVIENGCSSDLSSVLGLKPDISGKTVVIDRTHNILSDGVLPVKVRIIPLGYTRHIIADIGFTNPALTIAA